MVCNDGFARHSGLVVDRLAFAFLHRQRADHLQHDAVGDLRRDRAGTIVGRGDFDHVEADDMRGEGDFAHGTQELSGGEAAGLRRGRGVGGRVDES